MPIQAHPPCTSRGVPDSSAPFRYAYRGELELPQDIVSGLITFSADAGDTTPDSLCPTAASRKPPLLGLGAQLKSAQATSHDQRQSEGARDCVSERFTSYQVSPTPLQSPRLAGAMDSPSRPLGCPLARKRRSAATGISRLHRTDKHFKVALPQRGDQVMEDRPWGGKLGSPKFQRRGPLGLGCGGDRPARPIARPDSGPSCVRERETIIGAMRHASRASPAHNADT